MSGYGLYKASFQENLAPAVINLPQLLLNAEVVKGTIEQYIFSQSIVFLFICLSSDFFECNSLKCHLEAGT